MVLFLRGIRIKEGDAPHIRNDLTAEYAYFIKGMNGAPEEIRTPNLLIRSQMLYPVELRAREWPAHYPNPKDMASGF